MLLLLDVLFDDGQWCATHGRDKVTVGPQRRQATLEKGKVLAQFPRTRPLNFFDESVNAVLRIDVDQQVHVIWHHLEFDQISIARQAHARNNDFKRLVHAINQHGATVLRAPHDVVFARKEYVAIGTV